MNLKKIMKCTDKSFKINTTISRIKRRFVKFDFMLTLTVKRLNAVACMNNRCGVVTEKVNLEIVL